MEVLVGERITLCPLSYAHIFAYLVAFTHEVRQMLHVPDAQAEFAYVKERIALQEQHKTFFYCIIEIDSQQLIGALEIRGQEHQGQLYTWLHQAYWGKRYFQEALQLATHYYFMQTHELYITAHVDITNLRSYKALKRAGFADYARIDGAYGMQYELVLSSKVIFC